MVRLTDRPDMTLDVYCGCKTTMQQQKPIQPVLVIFFDRSDLIWFFHYQKASFLPILEVATPASCSIDLLTSIELHRNRKSKLI